MTNDSYITFKVADQHFALPVEEVEMVVQIVEQQAVPEAPVFISGMIDFHGEVVPVINMRKLFMLPEKDVELSDQLVITSVSGGKFALWVDETSQLMQMDEAGMEVPESVMFGKKLIKGVLKSSDGMILLNDLDSFLNKEELLSLEEAIQQVKNQ